MARPENKNHSIRWELLPQPPESDVMALSRKLNNIPQSLATVLWQRGIDSFDKAVAYFRPQLKHLHDPFLMKDMDKAVQRVKTAIRNEENILIYGDYDVDGTTSVALVSSFLKKFYDRLACYIPDRYKEGYGVSREGIDFAADNDIKLIIALDCGIKALDKVEYASENGIDFIICDHHTPGKNLPKAAAVLNPKRQDCPYPYKELSGCGVGFKLCQALANEFGLYEKDYLELLDLVAISIGADIVDMTGENRVLAYYGLELLNRQLRPGLKAMLGERARQQLSIHQVVFQIAPRINAAGRMDHGLRAVELLNQTDDVKAKTMAAEIEQLNLDRRYADTQITQEALEQIKENKDQDRFTTVVASDGWHKGVIGIVASRLTEHYYRPTIVFTRNGELMSASARSVSGFNVYEAISACSDMIIQFGGHKAAAGLTIKSEHYEAFKSRFEDVVRELIEPAMLIPKQVINAPLQFKDIDQRFVEILQFMRPFGPGNMRPVFMTENVADTGKGRTVGQDGAHLKLRLLEKSGLDFSAIGFGLGSDLRFFKDGSGCDIAYSIETNEWQGNVEIQLNLKAIKKSM